MRRSEEGVAPPTSLQYYIPPNDPPWTLYNRYNTHVEANGAITSEFNSHQ